MNYMSYATSDVGQRRDKNEDYLIADAELGLYLVCDGMGGHAAGEVASQTAAHTVKRHLSERRHLLDNFDDTVAARDKAVQLVEQAVKAACHEIYRIATSEPEKFSMGTTLTMLLVVGNKGIMAHVGDSRLYLRRDATLHQLSEDHNLCNELVKQGIAPQQARASKFANRITRAVGVAPTVQVDTLILDVLPGDVFLLCSDGLSHYFEDHVALLQVMDEHPIEQLSDVLVDKANRAGGHDNITGIIVSVESQKRHGTDRRRAEDVGLQLDTLARVDLFRHLDLRETVAVLGKLSMREYSANAEVIRHGDPMDQLYIVVTGQVSLTVSGQEMTRIGPGAHFGASGLFSDRPYGATIVALERVRLLVLHRDDFLHLVHSDPTIGVKLLWQLSEILSSRLDEAATVVRTRIAPRPHSTADASDTQPMRSLKTLARSS